MSHPTKCPPRLINYVRAMSGAVCSSESVMWLRVRGVLPHNFDEALKMARSCQHDDAKWLVSLFPEGARVTWEEAKNVFARIKEPRALYVHSVLTQDHEEVRKAAEFGYAPAQADMGFLAKCEKDRFAWAERAAAQGDPHGLVIFGKHLKRGVGCAKDLDNACAAFKQAAEMGDWYANWLLGKYGFRESEWRRYFWWGRAAACVYYCPKAIVKLAEAAILQIDQCEHGGLGRILFEIGAACNELVILRTSSRLGVDWSRSDCTEEAALFALEHAAALYAEWCLCAKQGIACWMWIGRHLGAVKDVRILIGNMLWADKAAWSERRKVQTSVN